MKLYIFQETGEFRGLRKEDWYQDLTGDFTKSDCDDDLVERFIFAMTEVEIPNNTEMIRIGIKRTDEASSCYHASIPIVRHKPKVKKWQWLYKEQSADYYQLSICHYATKEELKFYLGVELQTAKILEESEIEVEE